MTIQIDTREQANTHIIRYFDKIGVEHIDDGCLQIGDYYADGHVVVERKRNLIEFAANCGKNHQRFKRELERLDESGWRMYIIIEQEMSYEDMATWQNPRGKVKYRRLKNGMLKAVKPMTGAQMKAICDEWMRKHDIQIKFCNKKDTGREILNILARDW